MKHWQSRELTLLAAMRARFLAGSAGDADYWLSDEELALYDATFAARIGWKIDAAIRALGAVGWRPQSRRVLDWGCGTGIATRRVLDAWPAFTTAAFHDRSARAVAYASARLHESHPRVGTAEPRADRDTLLLVSHVLNELPEPALDGLLTQVRAAGEVIWIEAGTHADSRRLISIRERLLAEAEPPSVVAPCTHQTRCGLLAEENERHWCHHFAQPPAAVFQDARWHELSRELGIDLRALPYSYLVLTRHVAPALDGASRVLGGLRESKGYCRLQSCAADGVRELMLQKRDGPELFKTLTKRIEWPLFRWQLDAGKIVGGNAVLQQCADDQRDRDRDHRPQPERESE
ncbi:MAG: small ribosomal subunit Rsm22 family protein [Chthoniobacteraceae bacterium]